MGRPVSAKPPNRGAGTREANSFKAARAPRRHPARTGCEAKEALVSSALPLSVAWLDSTRPTAATRPAYLITVGMLEALK